MVVCVPSSQQSFVMTEGLTRQWPILALGCPSPVQAAAGSVTRPVTGLAFSHRRARPALGNPRHMELVSEIRWQVYGKPTRSLHEWFLVWSRPL